MSARRNAMSKRKSASSTEGRAPVRRAPRGQAMIEYSLVSHALLLGGAFAMLPLMGVLFQSFSKFYENLFFVLNNGAI